MTDTQTTKEPTAAPASRRRTTASRPQVSVRPVAVGALNAATVAGASIFSVAGPAGLAVAAGGAAALGAAGLAGKARSNRRTSGSVLRATPRTARRAGGLPRLGRSSSATPGRAGGSRSGTGARSGGTAGAKRSAAGRLFGGLGRSSGASSANRRAGGGGTGSRGASSASGSTRRRSPLTAAKVARARRMLASRRQAGPRLSDAIRSATTPGTGGKRPTARQAWSAARRAVTGDNPKRRGAVRRATAGLAAAGLAAGKTAWDARQRRKKAAAARAAKNARGRKPRVSTTVPPAAGAHRTTAPHVPAPKPAHRRPNHTPTPKAAPVTTGGTTMSNSLLSASEDFLAAAASSQPEGMLQVVADAHIMGEVLENVVRAMKIRYDRAQEQPLSPAIKDMYGAVHTTSVAVQQTAAEIGPLIERIHRDELDRLRNPRSNEEMWDVRANRGAA